MELVAWRDDSAVGDDSIHAVVSQSTWESHVMQLYRGGARGQRTEAGSPCMSFEIDQHVDPVRTNGTCDFGVSLELEIAPMLEGTFLSLIHISEPTRQAEI